MLAVAVIAERAGDNPARLALEALIDSVARLGEGRCDRLEQRREADVNDFWAGAEVISAYTRAQAIEDGFLVDLSEWAQETGFKVPVAVTAAAWALIEPTGREQRIGQDERGRAHDVLYMAFLAIRRQPERGSSLVYEVWFQFAGRPGVEAGLRKQPLKIHSGPGDEGEHVLTIMLPEED